MTPLPKSVSGVGISYFAITLLAAAVMQCHPERSPALFLSRRILAGEGRKGGSAFRGTIDNLSQL